MSLGKQAKILNRKQELLALTFLEKTRHAARNKVMFLLSIKAGLRAKEIACITWAMLTDPEGNIADIISLPDIAAKGNSGRVIPLNAQLKESLQALAHQQVVILDNTVIQSERNTPCQPKVIVNWFKRLYVDLGFNGCSSHSGRRTFVTRAANEITKAGGSLRDVQALAGHTSLNTTQRYIEGNAAARKNVVDLI